MMTQKKSKLAMS